jgi:GNAT superfamily N-acetyltransferase
MWGGASAVRAGAVVASAWHGDPVEVRRIEAGDEPALREFAAVWDRVHRADWPAVGSFGLHDFRAFAAHTGSVRRFDLLAAVEPGGRMAGCTFVDVPLLDNRHSAEVLPAMVDPDHRRRGAGTALVDHVTRSLRAEGRRVLNCIVDVPLGRGDRHPSVGFARALGFERTLAGNKRVVSVPLTPERVAEVRAVATSARDADRYRTFTFRAPWPRRYTEDHCELARRMSTDEPAGDSDHEEEVWDARRIQESDALFAAQKSVKLVAVAQHIASGRLVAFTELLLSPDRPGEAWQMATLVHPEHRGHRLGLSVKLANLEFLTASDPSVRQVVTGNASVNEPMIAVNDMLGFAVFSEGAFWQKHLDR